MQKAETLFIAERPFKVIKKRPAEVTLNVYTFTDGFMDFAQMPLDKISALGVLDHVVLASVISGHSILRYINSEVANVVFFIRRSRSPKP